MENTQPLTEVEARFMREVGSGADVFSYQAAYHLRQVQKKHPDFIKIVKAKTRLPDRIGYSQPYFGCKLTARGREALAKAEGK